MNFASNFNYLIVLLCEIPEDLILLSLVSLTFVLSTVFSFVVVVILDSEHNISGALSMGTPNSQTICISLL